MGYPGHWERRVAGDGSLFWAWRRPVPRIDGKLISCSIFLYPSVDDPRAGRGWGGSGFLLGVRSTAHPAMVHLYAVTNDHVRIAAPVLRYRDEEPMPGTADNWIPHPHGDDLAVRPLGLIPERERPYVDSGLIISSVMETYVNDIDLGDDCLMIGRYIAPGGEQRAQPVVRFGNLSMLPEPIYQDNRAFHQESFLVDMRSLSGFSGSPVFLYWVEPGVMSVLIPPRSQDFPNLDKRDLMGRKWLLGVDWGHMPLTQDVLDENCRPVTEGWRLTVNTGMAAVVPAWKLLDLLDMEELVKAREQQEEIQSKQVGAVLDASEPPEDPTGASR